MMPRDLATMLSAKPMTVEQRAKFGAIRDKYLELATLVEEMVPDSKARTKGTDLMAESGLWVRAAIEQIP